MVRVHILQSDKYFSHQKSSFTQTIIWNQHSIPNRVTIHYSVHELWLRIVLTNKRMLHQFIFFVSLGFITGSSRLVSLAMEFLENILHYAQTPDKSEFAFVVKFILGRDDCVSKNKFPSIQVVICIVIKSEYVGLCKSVYYNIRR